MSTNVVLLDVSCLKDSVVQGVKPTAVVSPALLLFGKALCSAGGTGAVCRFKESGQGCICLTDLCALHAVFPSSAEGKREGLVSRNGM